MKKNIVIIAHDSKKPDLIRFISEHVDWIDEVNFIATGRTAELMEKEGVNVKHLSPGKFGGYNEITEMISKKKIDMVIFFMDFLVVETHHIDIKNLLNSCNDNNIPLATNYASAELLFIGFIKRTSTERVKPKTFL
ncbi:MAG: methylglyoxal synthase [Bacteroidales bacterium]|nr:methylglyoxal synthase [Bacteroidales bacterium]